MVLVNRQIIQEAAEWFVEINSGDADLAARRKFDVWLRASPAHVRAFLEILPVWEEGSQLPVQSLRSAEQLLQWAQAASATDVVLPFRGTATTSDPAPGSTSRGRKAVPWRIAAAATAACAAAVLGYRLIEYPVYETGIAEQRSWLLADGSAIELNARSKIRVHLTRHRRDIELVQGQALFQVAHDKTRPFVVRCGQAEVTAVGTQFDVYKKHASTVVTVLEGRIAVEDAQSGSTPEPQLAPVAAPILVAAGGQATVTARAIETSEHADLAVATAWTQHELVFNRSTLSAVAEEFNRYNAKLLVVAPGLADMKISGIFSSTDSAPLLRFLQEQPGVKLEESARIVRILPADRPDR